eukprot:gene15127-16683_t
MANHIQKLKDGISELYKVVLKKEIENKKFEKTIEKLNEGNDTAVNLNKLTDSCIKSHEVIEKWKRGVNNNAKLLPIDIMRSCFSITASVVSMAAGPYAPVVSIISEIVAAVFSLKRDKESDLCSKVSDIMRNELKDFAWDQLGQEFSGLCAEFKDVLNDLSALGEMKNVTSNNLLNRELVFSKFPHFIGKLKYYIEKQKSQWLECLENETSGKSVRKETENYFKAVVLYYDASMFHLILLAMVMVTFKTGDGASEPTLISRRYKQRLEDIKEHLSFVPSETSQHVNKQLFIEIVTLCKTPALYEKVEAVREAFHMPKLYKCADKIAETLPQRNLFEIYPKPQERADSRTYFHFINHSNLIVHVSVNNNHHSVVGPYSYEHDSYKESIFFKFILKEPRQSVDCQAIYNYLSPSCVKPWYSQCKSGSEQNFPYKFQLGEKYYALDNRRIKKDIWRLQLQTMKTDSAPDLYSSPERPPRSETEYNVRKRPREETNPGQHQSRSSSASKKLRY